MVQVLLQPAGIQVAAAVEQVEQGQVLLDRMQVMAELVASG